MSTATEVETPRLELRKYPNRRYYDATRSCHVTLEEIHNLVRQGHNIVVTDSKSGEDITAKVLAQVLLEHDPPKLDVLPASMLHELIRANEQLVHDFFDRYFNQALTAFLESQRHFDRYLRQMMGLGGELAEPGDSDAMPPLLDSWKAMLEQIGRASTDATTDGDVPDDPANPLAGRNPPGKQQAVPSAMRDQLNGLQEQIDALEQRLRQRRGTAAGFNGD